MDKNISTPHSTSQTILVLAVIVIGLIGTSQASAEVPEWYSLLALEERLAAGNVGSPAAYAEPVQPPEQPLSTLFSIYRMLPEIVPAAAEPIDVEPEMIYWALQEQGDAWGESTGADGLIVLNEADRLSSGYLSEPVNLWDIATDLIRYNILTNRSTFGVTGEGLTRQGLPAPVPASNSNVMNGVEWPVPRFITYEDPAVTNLVFDQLTGLMWMKSPTSQRWNWEDAVEYAASLDGDDGLGGFTDWRLPTIREMQSLTATSNSADPYIPFQSIFSYDLAQHWTSTRYAGDTDFAWVIHLPEERFEIQPIRFTRRIWPVRGPLFSVEEIESMGNP